MPIKIKDFTWRQALIYVLTIVFSILYLMIGNRIATSNEPVFSKHLGNISVQAKVIQIKDVSIEETIVAEDVLQSTITVFEAEITHGDNRGMRLDAMHIDDPFSPYRLRPVEPGDKVFLSYTPDGESQIHWLLQEYRRTDYLFVLGVILAIGMVIFGRFRGFSTLITLTFTCLSIFMVFIPAILSGQNIYIYTIITGVFIITMTILLINGIDRKSVCAGIGCIAGFLVSGLLVEIMDIFLRLTGVIDEDSVYLIYLNEDNPINLRAIIFAAIVIGAVCAVMDVAISISSSLYEVFQSDPYQGAKSLWNSGMNIGRDIIGTMSNTLLLAYIGSSLSLVLLLVAYNDSLIALLNKEMIVVEILQALVGIAGLLLVIPLTTLACATVFPQKKDWA